MAAIFVIVSLFIYFLSYGLFSIHCHHPWLFGRIFQTDTGQLLPQFWLQQFHGLLRHASKPGGIRQISLEKFAGNFWMADGCLCNPLERVK